MFSEGTPVRPNLKRMMCFIDGENLVFQFQKLKGNGWNAKTDIAHKQDVYLWKPEIIPIDKFMNTENYRTTIYTSMVGDETAINETSREIKKLSFYQPHFSALPNNVTSYLLKKDKQQTKAKGVDIKLTTDILTNVFRNNLDIVYIVSGDGDFLPVIKECTRNGKIVFLGAFENGLNKKLLNYVDAFIPLEGYFFT